MKIRPYIFVLGRAMRRQNLSQGSERKMEEPDPIHRISAGHDQDQIDQHVGGVEPHGTCTRICVGIAWRLRAISNLRREPLNGSFS